MEKDACKMTEEELWQEMVWDKLQTHEYVADRGSIYDFESGEFICPMQLIRPD